jgi:integrase
MQPFKIGRRGDGFCLTYQDDAGKRRRISLATKDPAEARRLAPIHYAELTRPAGTTVADLWADYQNDMQGRAVAETMVHTWKAMRERFGPLHADEITIEHSREHIKERRGKGIGDGTIWTELGHLRMCLLWAQKRNRIDRAPDIERPAKPEPSDRYLTRAEVQKLLASATTPHIRTFITLAYSTAGRSAALLGLTWERVKFETGKIDLRDPTIKRRHKGRAIVAMNPMLRQELERARAGALTPYVIEWASERVKSVKRGMRKSSERAGLDPVNPHLLRHSAAVHLAEAGRSMDEIAQFLGHRDLNVTRNIYARFSPEHLREAAGVLDLTPRLAQS